MIQPISKTTILKYKYDSEEERKEHVKYMEHLGYECTGQIRKSDDPLYLSSSERKYYWYGEFYKRK